MARACVFIDGSNFYHACRENLGGRTDIGFGAFAAFLVGPSRDLVRSYYYTCPLPADHDPVERASQQKFLSALQRVPYLELRFGKLVRRDVTCGACGDHKVKYQEKGVDMRIGVDMVAGASKGLYDIAILVSGDGDLKEAVQAVKDLGKHVELATFRRGRSDELAAAADVNVELTTAEMTSLLLH
ncbi:MAG TPA: NYN domain-containing protein [Acidimicrobiales bacterium]|nr:NYN domain-containing protein [Acidimicrobiales bacterium]